MPMDKSRYPPHWKEISEYIRFDRANNHCEWCGVENYSLMLRDKFGVAYDYHDILENWDSDVAEFCFGNDVWTKKPIKIVLTTAHIGIPKFPGGPRDKHDKMDCRYNNLRALCQRCHINFDIKEHVENGRRTRYAKKKARIAATGQLSLW
jgi:hypothetical protein